ncbi:hypothetical protein [Acuticoccus mangrovi]|uniref:Uncharacterized protein n=1 Tax=Acuticoccus mangrovi TaxID=2796142 RepID=A0A934IPU3_9HYPH|nr:hypothetical protein [Acuticoccus mangrovi]MBJ3776393.1 hypothetical protein [Acuticoccus mangrovi]
MNELWLMLTVATAATIGAGAGAAVALGFAAGRVRAARDDAARWEAVATGFARRLGEAARARRVAALKSEAREAADAIKRRGVASFCHPATPTALDPAMPFAQPAPFVDPARRGRSGTDAR